MGAGERAIGQVYAANTVGSIAGVLLAVHVGLPLLGLKGLIIAGAAVDLVLGVWLLGAVRAPARRGLALAGLAASVVLVAGAAAFVDLDAHKMASGVFRVGGLLDPAEDRVLFQEDGKTATISVTALPDGRKTLRTNGKPDGSVRADVSAPGGADEATQVLLGALPLYYAPHARRIAVIGLGTGVTSHVLLAAHSVERLDTVEIEARAQSAAEHFQPFNSRALTDPRSRIHVEDAKTFFSAARNRYDVIVSEPSNPWVSGVASLFTTEFYRDIRRYLSDGGVFVQWVQLYETSPVLLASIMAAMRPHFADYAVWASNDGDLIIVAVPRGRLPEPHAGVFDNPRLAGDLASIGIGNRHDLGLHWIGARATVDGYFAAFGAPANSDFEPYLDVHAAKARFMREDARALLRLHDLAVPVLALLEGPAAQGFDAAQLSGRSQRRQRGALARQAAALEAYVLGGDAEALARLPLAMQGEAVMLRQGMQRCRFDVPGGILRWTLVDTARLVNGYLGRARAEAFWAALSKAPCLAAMDPAARRWMQLHTAIAHGDAAAISDTAQSLLDAEADLPDGLRAYALAALMAGRIRQGRPREALRVYGMHRRKLAGAREWQPAFQLLLGNADRWAG